VSFPTHYIPWFPLILILHSAWDEIHEVFGDGHEYDWALEGDDVNNDEEAAKPELKYQDVRY
jgi:hypothetical protein